MNFAVGFDLILPHNLMEPMLRELSAIRIVWLYIEPQKFDDKELLSFEGTWRLSSRVISGLAVGREIALVGLNEQSLLFVRL